MIERPRDTEYAPFYAGYISQAAEDDVLHVLESQVAELRRLAAAVPADRETFRYAPGKWSIRQVVGHLGDAERVFGYRAFRISRGDQTPLAGFDENVYVEQAGFDQSPLSDLVAELTALREANLTLLRRLDADTLRRLGTANGQPVSVRALAFILAGHLRHHFGILRERYGVRW